MDNGARKTFRIPPPHAILADGDRSMSVLGSSHGKLSAPFLGEVRRQPMLTREEEITLARRSSRGDQIAAARLVVSHLRFVVRIARAYRSYGLPMADLVQEGTVGLLHAVRKFNPDQGNRLATYAMWWIRAAIQEHVVRSWSLVRVGTTAARGRRAEPMAAKNSVRPADQSAAKPRKSRRGSGMGSSRERTGAGGVVVMRVSSAS